jgi:hypothetical protein
VENFIVSTESPEDSTTMELFCNSRGLWLSGSSVNYEWFRRGLSCPLDGSGEGIERWGIRMGPCEICLTLTFDCTFNNVSD